MSLDTNPVGKGYALWLVPEEPAFSLLAVEIYSLSSQFSTPRFDPHITLLGGIILSEKETLAKAACLAGILKPLRIKLKEIHCLDEYFRCLFVGVLPTEHVLDAHRAACEAFGFRDGPCYMPHVSLLYGKLHRETKKRIASKLGSLPGLIFEVRRLALYRVKGRVEEWKRIREFGLA